MSNNIHQFFFFDNYQNFASRVIKQDTQKIKIKKKKKKEKGYIYLYSHTHVEIYNSMFHLVREIKIWEVFIIGIALNSKI
jgi:hypothetical protein